MTRIDRKRLLLYGGMQTLVRAANLGPLAPAPSTREVRIGDVVDLGDGNEAVGLADSSNPHGIRIEIRAKGSG